MTGALLGLLAESRRRGFLGPGAAADHLRHALAFGAALGDAPARAVDLGAGGGLPGLVLAASVWPDTQWCLVDAQARRGEFLAEAVADLGLADRVEVQVARAETFGRDDAQRGRYGLVVARSFGPPAVTAECSAPLLGVHGQLVVSEPPEVDPNRWPDVGLTQLGLGPAVHLAVAHDVHLARMAQVEPCPDRFPRRVGIPTKRPLW